MELELDPGQAQRRAEEVREGAVAERVTPAFGGALVFRRPLSRRELEQCHDAVDERRRSIAASYENSCWQEPPWPVRRVIEMMAKRYMLMSVQRAPSDQIA